MAQVSHVIEVKLDSPIWRFSCDSGYVSVCAEGMAHLTAERANWLLDQAKAALLEKNK